MGDKYVFIKYNDPYDLITGHMFMILRRLTLLEMTELFKISKYYNFVGLDYLRLKNYFPFQVVISLTLSLRLPLVLFR